MAAKKIDVIGVSGVVHYGNRSRVEDEWHPNLRGRQWARVVREMVDNDAIIGGSLNLIKSTMRQVPWRAQEADGSDESKRWAEFLDQCMSDMEHTWPDLMADACSSVAYGYAPFEKVHKIRGGKSDDPTRNSKFDDGLVGLRGVFIRSQESLYEWQWDDSENSDGGVTGMWQQVYYLQTMPMFIPIEKMVLFKTENNRGSPEGRSLLRNVYRSWFFLKRIQELEAIGIERDLVGLPVIEVPLSLFEAKKGQVQNAEKASQLESFKRLVQQVRRNEHEGLVFPSELGVDGKPTGYKFKLVTSGGSRAIDTDSVIKRLQKEIGINFSTQFQQLGVETRGSQSLSSDMTSMFSLSLGALLDAFQETFNRQCVDELMDLNGVPVEFRPKWIHGDIEKPELQKFAETLGRLVDAGVLTPDPELETYVRETLQLPALSESDQILSEPANPEGTGTANEELMARAEKGAILALRSAEDVD